METLLGDTDRARAIYELAVNQPRLDMPELLWKAYIDFEVGLGKSERARELYERLLERTLHVKVTYLYIFHFVSLLSNYDEKYINKREREQHLPGYCQKTSLEPAGHDERR